MSSARDDRRAPRRHRLHLRREAVLEGAHAAPPFFFGFLSLSASARACAAASDSRTVTRSGSRRSIATMSRVSSFFSRSSATSVSSARCDVGLRQPHVDAVLEPQVPAPLGDQDRGAHLIADLRDSDRAAPGIPCARVSAPRPTTSGSSASCGATKRLEHGAVVGDDRDLAVLLPERERLALRDRDLQPAGIELEHGRFGDPGIGLEPRRAPASTSRNRSEVLPVTPAVARISSRLTLALAGERDRRDAEAGRVGGGVARVLRAPSIDGRQVAALDDAVGRRWPG